MDCLIPQQTKSISAWCILKNNRIIYEHWNGFVELFHFFIMFLQHLKIKLISLSRLSRLYPCQLDVFIFPRKKFFANLKDDNSRNARDSFLKFSFGKTRVSEFSRDRGTTCWRNSQTPIAPSPLVNALTFPKRSLTFLQHRHFTISTTLFFLSDAIPRLDGTLLSARHGKVAR